MKIDTEFKNFENNLTILKIFFSNWSLGLINALQLLFLNFFQISLNRPFSKI